MEFYDWIFVLIFGGIAAILYFTYLVKAWQANKFLKDAKSAVAIGDNTRAVSLLKKALWKANEKPAIENKILDLLASIYEKHNVNHNFEGYRNLIKQFQVLYKKSSKKAMNELKDVQSLKSKLIDKMPNLS